jgi:hypothetical protein
MVRQLSASGQPVLTQLPLAVSTDLRLGGRWTSLAAGGREWLWSRPDSRRATVGPGEAFIDVGGVEECFPTVRGEPDHGDVWCRPWHGSVDDAWVEAGPATLRRRLTHDGGAVRASYTVQGPSGLAFVHATHALLALSAKAHVEAAADRVVLVDEPGGPVEASWPSPLGRPLERFGPDDGTALAMVLPGCAEVSVVDGDDVLVFSSASSSPAPSSNELPLSTALWRNLGGWPDDAPYRSTGVEPLVGRGLRASEPDAAAVVPDSGELSWTVTVTAWSRA